MNKVLLCVVVTVALALADQQLQDFTTGAKLFTGDVYKQVLLDNNKNFLVSPFSADSVVALAQSGAKGATGEEIRTALHLPDTSREVEASFKSILSSIRSDHFSLVSANKIYVENNFAIKDDFKKIAADVYQADFQNLAFEESQEAAEEINKWVEEHTNNKIQDLMTPGDLDASTVIVLVDALYFNGTWSVPFDSSLTKSSKFYTDENTTIDAETMFQESVEYNYAESEELDAKVLELPLEGEDATVTIVLPNQKEGIAILEKQIDKVLEEPVFTRKYVQVKLPKFKIATITDFKEVLRKLGVEKAFDPFQADFSGLAGDKGDVYISQAKQKTYIEVNEIGVEAAISTEMGASRDAPPDPTKFFIVDHPFVFYLKVNGVIIFEGRVLEPEF